MNRINLKNIASKFTTFEKVLILAYFVVVVAFYAFSAYYIMSHVDLMDISGSVGRSIYSTVSEQFHCVDNETPPLYCYIDQGNK